MKGALVILAVLVLIGIVVYMADRKYYSKKGGATKPRYGTGASSDRDGNGKGEPLSASENDKDEGGEECCGMHIVCEKTSLSPVNADIEYYDDEELDRHRGKDAGGYTQEEIEEFRDILLSMRVEDIPGWSRSLQLRGINMPPEVKDELLLIVSEQRYGK